jgi:NADPH-dependent 2,4-dienoyl-CoA reductase/sulfur reductase-like enzyme
MKFVIIGGDAAGMSAASRAKRNRPDMDVIVLEKTYDVSYSACGMPYNLADSGRNMDDLVVRQAHVFRDRQKIDLRTGHYVEAIDVNRKAVRGTTHDGSKFDLPYDKLLIATGASPVIPKLPGFNLPGVTSMKSLNDGRVIRQFITDNKVKNIVIIGMGYIALEMCEAFRALGIEVDMVKPRPMFIPWMNDKLASVVKTEIETNNVRVHPGHRIEKIVKVEDGLKVICSDLDLSCRMVFVAVGVAPNSQLAEDAGLELGLSKSISVDKTLCTSNPEIYAAGDCADAYHIVTGRKTWIPLALRANRGGWAVADNVTGTKVELQGVAGTAVFKVFDIQVARTGLGMDEAKELGFEPVEAVIESRSRVHAHPGSSTIRVQMIGDRKSGRLIGAQMVGREGVAHRINAAAVALHAGMTVDEFARTDLAYAPPFGPVWDPMLTAANQLLKQI